MAILNSLTSGVVVSAKQAVIVSVGLGALVGRTLLSSFILN